MFEQNTKKYNSKSELYSELASMSKALFEGVDEQVSNLANGASLLHSMLEDISWSGFYLMKNGELILGPFMGNPACVKIPVGRGVCGAAAEKLETQIVENVHEFPGHIACDSASNSEIVIPIFVNGDFFGVLDIDSPSLSRFDKEDKVGLEAFVKILETAL